MQTRANRANGFLVWYFGEPRDGAVTIDNVETTTYGASTGAPLAQLVATTDDVVSTWKIPWNYRKDRAAGLVVVGREEEYYNSVKASATGRSLTFTRDVAPGIRESIQLRLVEYEGWVTGDKLRELTPFRHDRVVDETIRFRIPLPT